MEKTFALLAALACLLLAGCGGDAPAATEGSAPDVSEPAFPQEIVPEPLGQEAANAAYGQPLEHFGILMVHEEGFPNYPEEFGDAYYQDGFLWLCLTEDTPEVRQKYLDAVTQPEVLQFRQVDYGYNDLYKLSMAITRDDGIEFTSVGPNVMENRVDVGIPDLDRAQEFLSRITDALPEELVQAFPGELPIVFHEEGYVTFS